MRLNVSSQAMLAGRSLQHNKAAAAGSRCLAQRRVSYVSRAFLLATPCVGGACKTREQSSFNEPWLAGTFCISSFKVLGWIDAADAGVAAYINSNQIVVAATAVAAAAAAGSATATKHQR